MKDLFKAIFSSKGAVNIDGKEFSGRSITINGDEVYVDGVKQSGTLVGPVTITIVGNVERLETTSGRVEISGSAGNVKTMSGDVECGPVTGAVGTMSGDVTCGDVGCGVKTMSGDVRMGRKA